MWKQKKTALFMDRLHPSRLCLLKNLNFYPRTILDIGSHKGNWGKMVHKIWPKADIFMIEANEEHKEDLQAIEWLQGFEIALLGESNKKRVKYFASRNQFTTGNSIFREQTQIFDDARIRYLPMITLDTLVKKRGLKNIDFIKIDTQGSELNIILGGEKTISGTQFILLEIQNLEYNLGAPFITDVILEMKKQGFALYDIIEIHYASSGEMIQIEALFVQENSPFIRKRTF